MRDRLVVRFKKLAEDANIPEYKSAEAAGMDLQSNEDCIIPAGSTKLVSTGLAMSMPVGHEAQIRSRSGLAAKHGICVLNAPGTVDSDYRGEVKVILHNHSDADYEVHKGDRIAQMVIAKLPAVHPIESEELSDTDRGEGGFGSTGL